MKMSHLVSKGKVCRFLQASCKLQDLLVQYRILLYHKFVVALLYSWGLYFKIKVVCVSHIIKLFKKH